MRGAAGTDRGEGLLPAHAHADGAALPAGLVGGADAIVCGRDDRGRLDHAAGGVPLGLHRRDPAVGAAGGGKRGEPRRHVAAAEPTATVTETDIMPPC